MYSYIKGKVVRQGEDYLILENQNIGYHINMSPAVLARFTEVSGTAAVYTYLYVREDAIQLYGFADRDQQTLFNTLITVSGVGPKLALSILNAMNPDQFVLAMLNNDIKTLTTAKGLGKKGAERLVLELRDKIKKMMPEGQVPESVNDIPKPTVADRQMNSDVTAALLVLGYTAQEAEYLIRQSFNPEHSLEENINAALRQTVTQRLCCE